MPRPQRTKTSNTAVPEAASATVPRLGARVRPGPPRFGDHAAGKPQSMTNDVEKRWHDPHALRAATAYAVAVVLLAAAVFVVYALGARSRLGWAIATPGVL